jgi:pimeloyl-ACP methyl ester carboxylesterase
MLPHLDRFVAELVAGACSDGERPTIVGNSLGGVAALRAAEDPELPLGGVVAISPAGFGHQRWVDLFERDPILHRIVSARIPLPGAVIRWAVRTVYPRFAVHEASRLDPSVVAAYASRYRGRADVVRTVRDARRLLGELHAPYDLSRICRPVQLIWGSHDLLTSRKGARRLLDTVPEAELVVLDRCGHCAQVEQPDRVAELVVAFADDVEGRVREDPVER